MTELAFPIIDATEWPLVESEQLGTKGKVWVEDPDGESWLFKQVRADDRGGVRGEDWAEKLAAEVAVALRLPAAEVELATRPFAQGLPRGVLSRITRKVARARCPVTPWPHACRHSTPSR